MASPYVLFNGVTIPASAASGNVLLNGVAPASASSVSLASPWAQSVLAVTLAVASTSAYSASATPVSGQSPASGFIRFFWFTTPYTVVNTNVIPYCVPDAVFEFQVNVGMGGKTFYFNKPLPPSAGANAWLWVDTDNLGIALTLTAEVQEQAVATTAWA